MKFAKYILIALVFSLNFVPVTLANETDFSQLVAVEDISPEARLVRKITLTQSALEKAIEKVNEVRTKLENLRFDEGAPEANLKNKFLTQTDGYLAFYEGRLNTLPAFTTLEEINVLIEEVIAYRESIYVPEVKDILEYILVFSYTPAVIETANTRLGKVTSDVKKLEELKLVETDQFNESTKEAETLISEAQILGGQAKEALIGKHASKEASLTETVIATTTEEVIQSTSTPETLVTPQLPKPDPKELAKASLDKVKNLYDLFLATGQNIEKALGIERTSR